VKREWEMWDFFVLISWRQWIPRCAGDDAAVCVGIAGYGLWNVSGTVLEGGHGEYRAEVSVLGRMCG